MLKYTFNILLHYVMTKNEVAFSSSVENLNNNMELILSQLLSTNIGATIIVSYETDHSLVVPLAVNLM